MKYYGTVYSSPTTYNASSTGINAKCRTNDSPKKISPAIDAFARDSAIIDNGSRNSFTITVNSCNVDIDIHFNYDVSSRDTEKNAESLEGLKFLWFE